MIGLGRELGLSGLDYVTNRLYGKC